ncbi:MAG TPA: glycosyl hydrolase family 18 protein [Micropruina sp.]|nr:glycosyl hydrolase family 18 protein [Micropruina sp.]HMR23414.1 glycosyl hydrolase family 18 protein [Micropruina sp.]
MSYRSRIGRLVRTLTRVAAIGAAGALMLAGIAAQPAAAGGGGGHGGGHDGKHRVAPKTLVYVEVNNYDFRNVADYTLKGTNEPAFDLAMIFAANINYDTAKEKAYLHLNERVTETLENARTQIRPVQARGTKVLLSILGNHQGAGFANFPSYRAADAFAKELAAAVKKYRLDGIDLDDEWSQYGANGTGAPNDFSFVYLIKALRHRLGPDKLITFYNIGPSGERTVYHGFKAGWLIDYAYNPYYGSWQPPQIPGLRQHQLGAAAVDLTRTDNAPAVERAQRTVREERFGVYVTYNLTDQDHSAYLSGITQQLKGKGTVYRGR